jgi:hypothetical protein
MRTLLIAIVGLVVVGAGTSSADVICTVVPPWCVINNGSTSPNPDNVIDDASYQGDFVFVRNVGCPPDWPADNADDPCPDPGAPTQVELVAGGEVGRFLSVYDSSTITIVR